MTHLMRRLLGKSYPVAVGGDGPYVIDAAGNRYIDAASGAGVSCLGHSAERIAEAVGRQAQSMPYLYNAYFTTDIAERFADALVAATPAGLDWVYPGSGGSESMDGALKLALQYHSEAGQPGRTRFISRRQSYHGCTIGGLAISGNRPRRMLFEDFLPETHFVSPCYAYREREPSETDKAYGTRLADELDREIRTLGPETVAAFIAETVVGATAGCIPPVPGYLRKVQAVCRTHGVLLILDEILAGAGRCGTYLACEADGVVPDIVVLAKGLGAGYQPLSAILVSDAIVSTIAGGRGFFFHGHTYNCHATASAAGLAVLQTLHDENLLANVRARGESMMHALAEAFGQHPHVGDIRGRGLLIGLELVADRDSKATFDPNAMVWNAIQAAGMEQGLLCYPGFGTADGINGDHILLAPPFIIDDRHVDEIVGKLVRAVDTGIREATR
jgi:adenosylmethionine-8-amino-7-oxononanoate aminotransferase